MPLKKVGKGWKFGNAGKTYFGKSAKKKARKQGAAIEISKQKRDWK